MYTEDCGDEWPVVLSDSGVVQHIYSEYARLVSLIDLKNGMLENLLSDGCLTAAQVQDIESQTSNNESNRMAIDIIRRKSVGCFRRLLTCLIKAKQGHIAYILAGESGEAAL